MAVTQEGLLMEIQAKDHPLQRQVHSIMLACLAQDTFYVMLKVVIFAEKVDDCCHVFCLLLQCKKSKCVQLKLTKVEKVVLSKFTSLSFVNFKIFVHIFTDQIFCTSLR
jgi:hypothetical protein